MGGKADPLASVEGGWKTLVSLERIYEENVLVLLIVTC